MLSLPTEAWNALGHKVIEEIAWRQLEPAQRQEIVDTLCRHPRFDADFVLWASGGEDTRSDSPNYLPAADAHLDDLIPTDKKRA